MIVASNYISGCAFGILAAWPAMLSSQWCEETRTLVTATAALSNYVAGSAGVVIIPVIATTASELLYFFKIQAFVSILPLVAMLAWIQLPDMSAPADSHVEGKKILDSDGIWEGNTPQGRERMATMTLREEVGICLKDPNCFHILSLGLLIGLSCPPRLSTNSTS